MVITKTPYRISLFGGGTDHPAWYKENGGEVVSFAIDKFCYLSTRILPPFFNHKFRVAYSKVEMVDDVDAIQHPAVREAVRKYSPDLSLEIHHDGDLPARSGIGSSSAFAVGIIHSLAILQGRDISNYELAREAITLEQNDLNENVGSQDQVACALGGINHIKFGGHKNWEATPIKIYDKYQKEIERRIVLIYTGISRSSSDLQANLLFDLNKKAKIMERTAELSSECKNIISTGGNLDQLGEMFIESWSLKKSMNSRAITPELENILSRSLNAGALGGKVLGAGGGGFCMFWVKDDGREEFLSRFGIGVHVPIKISHEGSTCILK